MLISQVTHGRPQDRRSDTEEAIYDALEAQGAVFARVDHDPADTMEICGQIETVLGATICKNLFLCNRQQTDFYLLLMPPDKPFKTKFLSGQLGCSRLSFASDEQMETLLHCHPGSASALELFFDREGQIRLVIDRDLAQEQDWCGHPGRSTSTLRMRWEDLLNYVNLTGHSPTYVELPREVE